MIYELRIYTLQTGGVRELERRFGNNLDIRNKYSKMYGFWHRDSLKATSLKKGIVSCLFCFIW